ncbi:MYXO-CTERM sorting domain-containing protein [Nannocystis sp. ILAH1]|uniref:MYXO-CTERM sorting domain-containing protein n=1 Tax=unclassified Nannocystis TaxID=2627009 RepID=UPI00226E328E|nr:MULTISPECIES: MYXO-CTERM sorting domain-containing protein [unclassified Nannocystis]MCY0988704.1 MYXO-CTERM sorting domain-containing protein [Nannocystis sp. ILAH1]MCY1072481.1 MYXO-CTERM sorting domain-containing protein [Nannocystis sp. RBIL2]
MRRTFSVLLSTLALATPLLLAAEVQAASTLAPCGEIFVQGGAECEIYIGPVCEGMCKPVSLTAACAAELRAECAGECNAEASVECVGGCEADCQADCEVDPGEFNCQLECQADCSANCDGHCSASENMAECKGSCEATCSADCDGQCKVTPPEVDCEAKCQAACTGSCDAQADLDCQIDCQAGGYANCRADLEGGCKLHCQRPEGALFCDGQFVDVGDQLDACVDALKALLEIEVYAEGSASCQGNTCQAEGEIGCQCDANGSPAGSVALLGLGLLAWRRRRS